MQQKIYPLELHQLSLNKIDREALYIMEKLRSAGHLAYLVGGSVRDLLLQKMPKDYDISTSARPEEVKALFRNCILIGRRFRLAHIRFGRKIIEVATFRSGDIESEELVVRDNQWGTEEEDVLRRDFTINGLFYDSASQTIIDYVDGFSDLQKKYLKTIGQPYLRFKQDPVRMLRLLKFKARFNFEIDKETHIALLECRHEILKSSPARILEEFLRMLESGSASIFLQLITEHSFTELLLPTLAEFLNTEKGAEIVSYLEEVDNFHREPRSPLLERAILLSCLLFPLCEKRIQTHFIDRQRIPHLGQIQELSADIVDEVFRPLFLLPRRLRLAISSIVTAQYRMTPIEKRHHKKIRIPNDPDFFLALKFLEIRYRLQPALQNTWEEWLAAYQKREGYAVSSQ